VAALLLLRISVATTLLIDGLAPTSFSKYRISTSFLKQNQQLVLTLSGGFSDAL